MKTTIRVSEVLRMANELLAMRDDTGTWNDENRKGVAFLLESVLRECNAYAGFQSLDWINGGCARWQENGSCEATKESYCGPEYKRKYIKYRGL